MMFSLKWAFDVVEMKDWRKEESSHRSLLSSLRGPTPSLLDQISFPQHNRERQRGKGKERERDEKRS